MEEEIYEMYFTKQMKPIEISRILDIPKYKVSRVLQKDEKYFEEKQRRKEENKAKHIEETKEYIKEKRKLNQSKNINTDLILRSMHNQDSRELSQPKKLNNMSYRNWNVSAYDFNKKLKRFEFKEELGRSYDVPKFINVEV